MRMWNFNLKHPRFILETLGVAVEWLVGNTRETNGIYAVPNVGEVNV